MQFLKPNCSPFFAQMKMYFVQLIIVNDTTKPPFRRFYLLLSDTFLYPREFVYHMEQDIRYTDAVIYTRRIS